MTFNSRILPIDGAFNLRDLGGYATAQGETRFAQALRADTLARLTADDIEKLTTLGLRRVIDLRSPHEVQDNPGKLSSANGVEVINLPLFDNLAPSFSDLPQGVNPLTLFYRQALDERSESIKAVFEAIASAPEGAVLFHCTVGKDRTGLIAALWLTLAGVPREEVIADYALTATQITKMIPLINADLATRGIDPEVIRPMLACEPAFMKATLEHVDAKYGSVAAYLAQIGLSDETLSALRARLI